MFEPDLWAQSPALRGDESEPELAARFERDAFPLLDPLYRAGLWLTGDPSEAEDLLQETIINAYREFGSIAESTNHLRTWLYRTLTNTYIRSCRYGHRRRVERPIDTTIDRLPHAAAAHSAAALSLAQVEALEALPTAVIARALQSLERDTRMAVYYADVEGFSNREIAHITNRSVSAVMSLLARGHHQLRHVLLGVCRKQAASPSPEDPPKNLVRARHAPLHRLSESDTCVGQLDWFDREIVRYVLLWAPEGDVWDEDVYPEFGMTVEQLVHRFHRIIDRSVPGLGRLAKSDRELVDKARQLPRMFGQAR
jgi:RNA polymerase sigma-70 factor (ECF subfamily)